MTVVDGKKKCSVCGEWKDVTLHFTRHRESRDGWQYRCRECRSEIELRNRRSQDKDWSVCNESGFGWICDKEIRYGTKCAAHHAQIRRGVETYPIDGIFLVDGVKCKKCTRCKKILPLENFSSKNRPAKSEAGARSANCRACRALTHKLRQYNISIEELRALWTKQRGTCPVCDVHLEGIDFHVDHDHSCCKGPKSCGKCVRGLLHGSCNTLVGHFEIRQRELGNIKTYLLKNRKVVDIAALGS